MLTKVPPWVAGRFLLGHSTCSGYDCGHPG